MIVENLIDEVEERNMRLEERRIVDLENIDLVLMLKKEIVEEEDKLIKIVKGKM